MTNYSQREHRSELDSLSQLANQIEQWRASRTSRRERTPDSIRRQAVELIGQYKKSHILFELKINNKMLKNWQNEFAPAPEASPIIDGFTPLPIHASTPTHKEQSTRITSAELSSASTLHFSITLSSGCDLTFTGQFTSEHLTALARGVALSAMDEART